MPQPPVKSANGYGQDKSPRAIMAQLAIDKHLGGNNQPAGVRAPSSDKRDQKQYHNNNP